MKIVVCAKVCDGEINIFDKCAVESALRLSDDVTVISMGPKSFEAPLKELTRLGVRVILLCDNAFRGADTVATSYVLSLAINKLPYDLVICGRQTTDGDTAQTGAMLSARLGCGLLTNVLEIKSLDSEIKCRTRLSYDASVKSPAVITIERINNLRFPRMRSKTSEIVVWDAKDLGADIDKCGLCGSPTRVIEAFENKSGKRKCRFIKKEELKPLINELIKKEQDFCEGVISKTPFKEVWAIGETVAIPAKTVAKTVRVINETDVYKICQMAKEEKPDVILWNADLWGRENAPIAAILLETGLCADCIKLETDGEFLYMYRPARSGNIIAKIKCLSKPQMATVRCVNNTSDVIVSAGRGVIGELDKVKKLADELNGEFCVSRAVVDAGEVPVDIQVGMTGKCVSPKVYVAIGISGAVHHTCAIENAGTVIAINPDKDARIFEYADFGILDTFDIC